MNMTVKRQLKVLYKSTLLRMNVKYWTVLILCAVLGLLSRSVFYTAGYFQCFMIIMGYIDEGTVLCTNKLFLNLPLKQNDLIKMTLLNFHLTALMIASYQIIYAVLSGSYSSVLLISGTVFINIFFSYLYLFRIIGNMRTGMSMMADTGNAANLPSYKAEDKNNTEEVKRVKTAWCEHIYSSVLMLSAIGINAAECGLLYSDWFSGITDRIGIYILSAGLVLFGITLFFRYKLLYGTERIYIGQ